MVLMTLERHQQRCQCRQRFVVAWAAGRALTLEQAIQLAMSDTSGGK
jgi:hypothetical protein